MKRAAFCLSLFTLFGQILICPCLHAQIIGRLWGMACQGGDSGGGVIFYYDKLNSYDSTVYTMPATPETPYYTTLLQASDGNLYGTTEAGGSAGAGTIFKYNPSSGALSTVASFAGDTSGSSPRGSVIQASDGNLYGMTLGGGSLFYGTIFKCTLSGTLTTLVTFNSSDGSTPDGSLLQASDSNFYGMTSEGGTAGDGTLFKCTLAGTLTTLVSFTGANGSNPDGNVIQGTDGNLYGMTQSGGAYGKGTIFKCSLSGTLTTLVNFNDTNGAEPLGTLLQATDGNFYSMTLKGGASNLGTLFKCTSAGVISTLINFNGTNGANPYGSLMQATDGAIYGMTTLGGASNNGTIFQYALSGSFTTLYNFNGAGNGANPGGSLMQDTDGYFYGLAYQGGTAGDGTLFKCSSTDTITTLVNFGITPIGYNPAGSLIQAKNGNLYGLTYGGGTSGYPGTLFTYNTLTDTLSVLANFNYTNGANPYGALIQATDSNFYGMTEGGGLSNNGTLFKCTASGTLTTLVNFNDTNGSSPFGSLIQATDGNLYGLTYQGGSSGKGTLFKCTTAGVLTTLVNFNDTNGANPFGSLIEASDGNLYGMTLYGGTAGDGVIFKCSTTGAISTLVNFNGTNGETPYGDLLQALDGNFYGTTEGGGSSGKGTVFKCTLSGMLSTLVNFNITNGSSPSGSVIQASDSILYGMTLEGGTADRGTLFSLTTAGTFSSPVNFTGPNGLNPQYGKLLEVMSVSIKETCPDTALYAYVRGAKMPCTYSWSTGATASIIKVSSAGDYSVTVTDSRGITVKARVVYNGLLGVIAGSGDTICSGASAGLSATGKGGIGALSYTWMPGNLNGTLLTVNPAATTVYTVTVTDADGCTSAATQKIKVNPTPTIAITGTRTIKKGSSDTLIANGACTYEWQPGGSNKDTLIVFPALNTTYTLQGTCNGCTSVDTFSVNININTGINELTAGNGQVAVYPNPNNGIFSVQLAMGSGSGQPMQSQVEIYNVLGEKVYSNSFNIQHSTFNIDISNQPSGIYFITFLPGSAERIPIVLIH